MSAASNEQVLCPTCNLTVKAGTVRCPRCNQLLMVALQCNGNCRTCASKCPPSGKE